MPARPSRGARRIAVPLIGLALIATIGYLLSYVVLPRAGARWLSRWGEAGFPGQTPQGIGPTFHLGLPPSLTWSDIRWNADDSIRVVCRRLDVTVRPLRLMEGGLQITRISAEGLRVNAGAATERWCRAVLDGLADTLGRGEPAPPAPASIRFDFRDVGLQRGSLRIDRLSGWCRAPRRGTWESEARILLADGRGVMVQARGSGGASAAEIEADLTSASGRRLNIVARRASREPWTWRASAQDDGRLLLAVPPLDRFRSLGFEGEVDLWLERGTRRLLDGEAHIRGGRLSIGGGSPWDLSGTICVGGDTLSVEDLAVSRGTTRISGELAVPLFARGGTGRCALDGELSGRAARARGLLRRVSDRWTFTAPQITLEDRTLGSLEVTVSLDAADARDPLQGKLVIGGGSLSLLGGTGVPDRPLRLRLADVPMETILPLLPVSLPGQWTGLLATDASLWSSASGWRATGVSTLSEGRVANLPFLADLAGLTGGGTRSTLRIARGRARWLWGDGRIWADSLAVESKDLAIGGSLGYASADSILGLLRIEASGEGQVGQILRLIGGRTGLDLGIAGEPARPTLTPLDGEALRAWLLRVDAARPRWGAR